MTRDEAFKYCKFFRRGSVEPQGSSRFAWQAERMFVILCTNKDYADDALFKANIHGIMNFFPELPPLLVAALFRIMCHSHRESRSLAECSKFFESWVKKNYITLL